MKNILVTGANGQLGNEMRVLSAEYKEYTCFFTDVAELDICDEQAVMTFVKENNIHVIVNCAAYTAVDKAEDDIELCTKLNKNAVSYLAKAAEANWGEFIQISTDYVFDGTKHLPYNEGIFLVPILFTARPSWPVKRMHWSIAKTMIIRTAWLYSTFGNNFVKTMLRLGKEKETLGVVFDQIGTPTYARDLARAIFTAIYKGVVPGVYHFSDEGVCSWYDFTKAIHRIAGITTCKVSPLHTNEYPAKAPRPHYSVLDKTKIKTTYNIEIPHWEESLEACIKELNA